MQKKPNLLQALIPIAVLITLLVLNVVHFGDHTLDGANQFALILASAVAGMVAISLGVKWDSIRDSMVRSIGSAMPSILILLMIGALAGTWLISGVVPTLFIVDGPMVAGPALLLGIADVVAEAKKQGIKYFFIEDESSRVIQQVPQSMEFQHIKTTIYNDSLVKSHYARQRE